MFAVQASADPYSDGMAAFASEDYETAIANFQSALARRPGFAAYNYMLAMSYLRSGRSDSAIATFRKVVTAKKLTDVLKEKAYVNLLRTLVDNAGIAEVETTGKAAATAIPESAEVRNQIGRARLNAGKFSAAVDILVKATRLDSNSWTIYNNLGLAYLKLGNLKGAMHAFERAASLNSRLPFVYNNLGVTYEGLHRYADAEKAYRKALALDSGYAKAVQSLKRVKKMSAREQTDTYVIKSNK